jgi:hypothetical protein
MDRLLLASEILQDIGSRRYVSGLFDRLAGRGHDGNTHAPLLSLADRSAGDHLGHQSPGAFLDPFHAVISIANWGEDQRLDCCSLNPVDIECLAVPQDTPGDTR